MRLIPVLTLIAASVTLAADSNPTSDAVAKRLDAERTRREYFQLALQESGLQAQLKDKAKEANDKIAALKTDCEASTPPKGKFNGDDLSCNPLPPAPPAAPEAK